MEWGAIALGGVGAAVMLMGRDLQGSVVGTLVILLGTTCWSLGTVLARRVDIPHGPTGFGAEMLAAGLLALMLSALLGEHWTLPESPRVWWAWAYLVVFGSLIAFSAYRFVVERVSATLASTYAYVNPPVALLVGWWLGHESFSSNILLGLPIVLGAVALHAWVQTLRAANGAETSTLEGRCPERPGVQLGAVEFVFEQVVGVVEDSAPLPPFDQQTPLGSDGKHA